MTLIVLSIIYVVIVAGDIWITLWATGNGKAYEWNFLLHEIVYRPLLFTFLEIALFAVVVLVASYFIIILPFAILFRGMILVHNICVVRSK